MNGLGALLGLAIGTGAHLVITAPTPWVGRRVRLRIAAHRAPSAARGSWLPRLAGAARMRGIATRQLRAGLAADPTAHLLQCLLAASVGLATGLLVVAAMTVAGLVHQPAAVVVLLAVCTLAGWLLAEQRLDRAGRRRLAQATVELPGIASTLAIAVASGAGLAHALELASTGGDGPLAGEFTRVLQDTASGMPLDAALAAVAERVPVAPVARFVDALRITVERGTPVREVLHAQASDARAEARRLLLERAGRKEALMLVPIVLLVLPAVVVVALFPGLAELGSLANPG